MNGRGKEGKGVGGGFKRGKSLTEKVGEGGGERRRERERGRERRREGRVAAGRT